MTIVKKKLILIVGTYFVILDEIDAEMETKPYTIRIKQKFVLF